MPQLPVVILLCVALSSGSYHPSHKYYLIEVKDKDSPQERQHTTTAAPRQFPFPRGYFWEKPAPTKAPVRYPYITGSDYSADLAAPQKACGPTINGPGKGKECILPFKHKGTNKTYDGCTTDMGSEYWCSTKVDEEGYHLSGNWGECAEGCPGVPEGMAGKVVFTHCPTDDDRMCQFPFSKDGMGYKGCLPKLNGTGARTCHTTADSNKLTYVATCSSDCPKDVWLTHKDLTLTEILQTLMEFSMVSTVLENRESSCVDLLTKKYDEMAQSKPNIVQFATNFKDALKEACSESLLCKGKTAEGCGAWQMEKRKNLLVSDDGGKYDPKSDCKIECGTP